MCSEISGFGAYNGIFVVRNESRYEDILMRWVGIILPVDAHKEDSRQIFCGQHHLFAKGLVGETFHHEQVHYGFDAL